MSATDFFESRVRPLPVKHGYECHSEAEISQKGCLLLDRESAGLEAGDSASPMCMGRL